MLTDEGSGSLRFAKDYVGADYHNEGHSHIDAFCHVAFDGRLYGGVPAESVTERGATRARSTSSRTAWWAAACCRHPPLTGSGLARARRVRVPRGPRGRGARSERDGRGGRHPARAHRSRAPAGRVRPMEDQRGEGRSPPRHGDVPEGALGRRARVRRQQRHRSQRDRGRGLPDARARPERDGRAPARLPPVRGPGAPVRGGDALGVPVRRRAAAHPARHGSPVNPIAIF